MELPYLPVFAEPESPLAQAELHRLLDCLELDSHFENIEVSRRAEEVLVGVQLSIELLLAISRPLPEEKQLEN